jgi:hypothetical protein
MFAGNVYPVVENPNTENSFSGKALMKGYTSHYVLTNKMGQALSTKDDQTIDYFDEFVCLVIRTLLLFLGFFLDFDSAFFCQVVCSYL